MNITHHIQSSEGSISFTRENDASLEECKEYYDERDVELLSDEDVFDFHGYAAYQVVDDDTIDVFYGEEWLKELVQHITTERFLAGGETSFSSNLAAAIAVKDIWDKPELRSQFLKMAMSAVAQTYVWGNLNGKIRGVIVSPGTEDDEEVVSPQNNKSDDWNSDLWDNPVI